jgi:hypothetical protein
MDKEFSVQVIYLRSRRVKKNPFKELTRTMEPSPQDDKAREARMADGERLFSLFKNVSVGREEI